MEKPVFEYLQYLKIPISKRYCEKIIQSHTEYPSLLSIADAFERLGIESQTAQIQKEDLPDIEFPYLLQINTKDGTLILIKNQRDLIEKPEILELWNGIVIKIAPTSVINNEENNKFLSEEHLSKKLITGSIVIVISFLLYPFSISFSLIDFILITFSFCGIFVGYLLLAKDLGVKYAVVEVFCNAGKETSCDKILNSDDSKIFGWLKLSDLVMTYFIFQAVLLSVSLGFSQITLPLSSIMIILSLFTIPIVLFSLYYQYFIAKTWCRLCIIVSIVLILQSFCFLYVFFQNTVVFSFIALLASLLLFVLIGSLIVVLKIQLSTSKDLDQKETEASRILNSTETFLYHLKKRFNVDNTHFPEELRIGNPEAAIQIIVVSNFNCDPCRKQHEVLEKLVTNYPDKICLSFRFVVSILDATKMPTTNQYILQYWYDNIFGKLDESVRTGKLLKDWYLVRNLEKFKVLYPSETTQFGFGEYLQKKHVEWINRAGVSKTPTFFINGYQLSQLYHIKHLLGFVPGLAYELQKIKTEPNNVVVAV